MKWYYWFNGERGQKGPSKHDLGRLDLTSFGGSQSALPMAGKKCGVGACRSLCAIPCRRGRLIGNVGGS